MRHTDIAIVGGGIAGSAATAMLGRAGIDAVLIDPHAVYPFDFRCEKLDAEQQVLVQKTGLANALFPATTPNSGVWTARMTRLIEKRANNQRDMYYDTIVNAARAAIPKTVPFLVGKVAAITATSERQSLTLSDGQEISARLVVLATGLNNILRQSLGIEREVISACHSVSVGFDMVPVGRTRFPFPALDYYAERPSDRIAYLTLFPIRAGMRANLFTYRDAHDPWLKRLRENPRDAIFEVMPRLRRIIDDFGVTGEVRVRPVDLVRVKNVKRPGAVVIGDAFATTCPAAGTGNDKVFTDIERLCNHHIPRWLQTPGMGVAKIAEFYDDPVKRACDKECEEYAFELRTLCTDPSFKWAVRRGIRFMGRAAIGLSHAARRALQPKSANSSAADSVGLTSKAPSMLQSDGNNLHHIPACDPSGEPRDAIPRHRLSDAAKRAPART